MMNYKTPQLNYRSLTPNQHRWMVSKRRSLLMQERRKHDAPHEKMTGPASIKEDDMPLGTNPFMY